jgi:hypothetical protein
MREMDKTLIGALNRSKKSLDKIGEGDWTPQDIHHLALVKAIEEYLHMLGERKFRTGRIIHGDNEGD